MKIQADNLSVKKKRLVIDSLNMLAKHRAHFQNGEEFPTTPSQRPNINSSNTKSVPQLRSSLNVFDNSQASELEQRKSPEFCCLKKNGESKNSTQTKPEGPSHQNSFRNKQESEQRKGILKGNTKNHISVLK